MKAPQENTQEPQKETVQRVQQEPSTGGEATIADNRPAIAVQRKLRSAMGGTDDNTNPIQRKANNTGLPDNLKSGIENLSGYGMDDVKVHYNSNKPAQLQAHAYAQGTDIHLAPGQEKHLPHEAWHVVQQKQGRVKPTMQFKGKVGINNDAGLEKEADVMGEKALQKKSSAPNHGLVNKPLQKSNEVVQGRFGFEFEFDVVLTRYDDKHDSYSPRGIGQKIAENVGEYLEIHSDKKPIDKVGMDKDGLNYDPKDHIKAKRGYSKNLKMIEIVTKPLDEFDPEVITKLEQCNEELRKLLDALENVLGKNTPISDVLNNAGLTSSRVQENIRVGASKKGGQNVNNTYAQATFGVQLSKVQEHFERTEKITKSKKKGTKFVSAVKVGNKIAKKFPSLLGDNLEESDWVKLKAIIILIANYMMKLPARDLIKGKKNLAKSFVGLYFYKTKISDLLNKLSESGRKAVKEKNDSLIEIIIKLIKSEQGDAYRDPKDLELGLMFSWESWLNDLFSLSTDHMHEGTVGASTNIEPEEIGKEGAKDWAVIMENRFSKDFYKNVGFEGARLKSDQIPNFMGQTLQYLGGLHRSTTTDPEEINTEDAILAEKIPGFHEDLQPVWNTGRAYQQIVESAQGPASKIVPVNIEVQKDAKNYDNNNEMHKSQKFSSVGYEFEFAQLAFEERTSDFGKESHLTLAEGAPFPMFNIPFAVETDMSAVIELAMPPILMPRNPRTKKVNTEWSKQVLLKIEGGLKGLAKNSSENLETLLGAVQTFLGLEKPFILTKEGKKAKAVRYGFMEKNSRITGKYTTAQANIVTTLEEAIELSYDKNNLPEEIEKVRELLVAKLVDKNTDSKGYSIFIAQKISEIPYMFFDSLHAKSLIELNDKKQKKESNTSTFDALQTLVGYEHNNLEKNKLHKRTENDGLDITKHATRTLISKVKGRGYGWIKSTLGQEAHKFPKDLITASLATLSEDKKIKEVLKNTVAFRTMSFYDTNNPDFEFKTQYEQFVTNAIAHYINVLEDEGATIAEGKLVKKTDEQFKYPDNRSDMSSARPDTAIILGDDGVAYERNEENDAVLVEIRKATQSFGIKFSERTTSKPPKENRINTISKRAKIVLGYYNDKKWVEAYKQVNPPKEEDLMDENKNSDIRVQKEKEIFELLYSKEIDQAKNKIKELLGDSIADDLYWKTIIKIAPPALQAPVTNRTTAVTPAIVPNTEVQPNYRIAPSGGCGWYCILRFVLG